MEIAVRAEHAGVVSRVLCEPGTQVHAGTEAAGRRRERNPVMDSAPNLSIDHLLAAYRSATLTPREALVRIRERAQACRDDNIWIIPESRPRPRLTCERPRGRATRRGLPLYGIPFAIKDNIDLAGMPTTAACAAFAYNPAQSAPVVERLIDGRRHAGRQNQSGPVRHRTHRHPLALRRVPQRLRPALHRRRLEFRLGGGGGAGPGELRARHRHRRLRPGAGGVQQPHRLQAHPRPA